MSAPTRTKPATPVRSLTGTGDLAVCREMYVPRDHASQNTESSVLEDSCWTGLCWSVCPSVHDMDPDRQTVNTVSVCVCRVGVRGANTMTLNLWLLNHRRRPVSLGFLVTSEKQTLETFPWRTLGSRVFKKQLSSKGSIRESEPVETGTFCFPIFHLKMPWRKVSSGATVSPQVPWDEGAPGSHLPSRWSRSKLDTKSSDLIG